VEQSDEVTESTAFRHEALLYGSDREFLDGTLDFITEGLDADEPVLVVLAAAKIDALREALGADATRVQFADMTEVGANPARIIPAWQDFADVCTAEGLPFRGIGEPIWAERSADELVECQRHEALLNVAFADTPSFQLLCPYDTARLDDAVLAEALRSHGDRGRDVGAVPLDAPLPEPSAVLADLVVDRNTLRDARRVVTHHGLAARLTATKLDDLLVAVSEVVTNSVLHGGGQARLRVWSADGSLICEIRDTGCINDPLAGRVRPAIAGIGGRGLWLATQLCDLLQLRASDDGNAIRLHMRVP
jgi:anti-sigma regulatory factor (Ser/Thr protein kinase)